jgi:hypothetical protein
MRKSELLKLKLPPGAKMFLVIGPNVWGRGHTVAQALKFCRCRSSQILGVFAGEDPKIDECGTVHAKFTLWKRRS